METPTAVDTTEPTFIAQDHCLPHLACAVNTTASREMTFAENIFVFLIPTFSYSLAGLVAAVIIGCVLGIFLGMCLLGIVLLCRR